MTEGSTDNPVTTDAPPDGETRGTTTIAESVVAKIASLAAREVDGVEDLGGALSGALAGVVGRIRGDEHRTAGVGVEVGRRQAAVDLSMTVCYPFPLQAVTGTVRDLIIERIETLTGLDVVEVNIVVTELAFGDDGDSGSTAARSRVA